MKKFSFCMPYYKNAKTLAESLGSIMDQDYPEKEVIITLDGEDSSARAILKTFPDVTVMVTPKPQSGAPVARNMSASRATGDYLVFLDPDTRLLPGALREWADAFDENPDCGFVYSGFRIKGLQGQYPSEPFSPYLLEINNYINGMNPMRKEVFPGWDENCKSFQDWEMWLRIVKSGVKGHYLGMDVCYFETDPPRAGGLSEDSHKHYFERKGYIQKKLNLPVRDMCVTSLAAIEHAKRVAELLNIDYVNYEYLMQKPHKYKLVYLLGMFIGNGARNYLPFYDSQTAYFKKGLVKVIHWIGTDILHLRTAVNFQQTRELAEGYNNRFVQFSQSPANTRELKEAGMNVKLLPLPVFVPELKEKLPLPEKFTVAIYDHGQSPNDIYCAALMTDIITSMPDVDFIYYGDRYKEGSEKNVKFAGHKPINEIIAQSSCLMRITKHDGFPVSPIEFMVHNRPTITNQDFPYMRRVEFDGVVTPDSIPKVKKDIISALRQYKEALPGPTFFAMARSHYKRWLNTGKLKQELIKLAKAGGK